MLHGTINIKFNNAVLSEEVTCRRIRWKDGHGWLVDRNLKVGMAGVFLGTVAYHTSSVACGHAGSR